MRKVVINAPPPPPMGLEECAESFEKTAELLKSMKKWGVTLPKSVLYEEDHRPPKVVPESGYAVIVEIAEATGLSVYDSCLVLEAILVVVTTSLLSGSKVKINRFGTLQVKECPRGPTVQFTVSPVLQQALNG